MSGSAGIAPRSGRRQGRRPVGWVVRPTPSCEQHLRPPGHRQALPDPRPGRGLPPAAGCSGWAKTHRLAARSSSRCRAWPARSQSRSSVTGVSSAAVTAGAGPPAVSRPEPRPRSKSRCGSRPGLPPRRGGEGVRGHAVPGLAARLVAPPPRLGPRRRVAVLPAARARRSRPVRRGPPRIRRPPASRPRLASPRSRASSPSGSGPGSNGPRCVCRCGTALSIFRSSPVIGAGRPSRTRASTVRRVPGGTQPRAGSRASGPRAGARTAPRRS